MERIERIEELRDLFDVTREFIYLNHAAMGPLPRPVVAAVTRVLADQAASPDLCFSRWEAERETVRAKMAVLLNASPDEIAFTKNTPEGISLVASGLPWQAGENVVTAAVEFPANVYPWLNLQTRGVEVRFVQPVDGRLEPDGIFARVDRRTRVVALSHVEFANGFRNDLATIGRRCRDLGIVFVVDAIQGLGAFPIDVQAQCIDALAASSHKWLCAPPGVGWFFCRRDLQDRLALTEIGQASVTPRASYLDYTLALQPSARRFESGMFNMPGIAGLGASLDLLGSVGIDRIAARILHLTDRLAAGLEQRGYRLTCSRRGEERSGIVTFVHERYRPETIIERLRAARIVAVVREGAVRVSPHFYNTDDEIDRLLDALP